MRIVPFKANKQNVNELNAYKGESRRLGNPHSRRLVFPALSMSALISVHHYLLSVNISACPSINTNDCLSVLQRVLDLLIYQESHEFRLAVLGRSTLGGKAHAVASAPGIRDPLR